MAKLILLPLNILKFWYLEAPFLLFSYFSSLNIAFLNLFSLSLMIKTFFKPWKNEYREGLIRFSIFMGIAIKSILIITDLFLLAFLVVFEIIVFIAFLAWPFATFYMPFLKL